MMTFSPPTLEVYHSIIRATNAISLYRFQRLQRVMGGPLLAGRIALQQAIAIDKDYRARHLQIIVPWRAMALR